MKLLKNLLKTPGFCIGMGIFLLTLFIALFSPFFYKVDIVTNAGLPYSPPSADHLMACSRFQSLFFGLCQFKICVCFKTPMQPNLAALV